MDGWSVNMRTDQLTMFCIQLQNSSEYALGAHGVIENILLRPIALVQYLHVSWHPAGVEGEWQMQSAKAR